MKIRFAAALFALSFPLLAQDPAASEALFYKAYWLQNGERNFAEAMTLYDKFLQAAPEHPLVGRAAQFQFELLTRAGKTEEAKAFAVKYEKQLGKVAVPAPAAPKADAPATRPAGQAGGDNAQRLADLKKQLEEAKASGDEETATRLQRQIARLEQAGGEGGGPGGPGGRGARGGMFGSKKLAEMTPEELEQFKGGMERMSGMIERMKEANPDGAKSMEENFNALKTALDANNLEEAQKVLDKVRESMPQRGGRGGRGGQGGGGGGAPGRAGGGGGGGGN